MIITKHEYKNRIVLDLEESEFSLIAHLVERANQKAESKKIIKESIPKKLHREFQRFINEKF